MGPQTLFLHWAWKCLKLALGLRRVFFLPRTIWSFNCLVIHCCSEHHSVVMPVERYAEEYNMNHNRRGKAVIFNHDVFEDKSRRRIGSAVDVSVLKETYGALGFEVVYENLRRADIQNAVAECKFKQVVLN